MKTILNYITVLLICLTHGGLTAQTPENTKLPEKEEGTFSALSPAYKFEAAIKAEDVDLPFDILDDAKGKFYAVFFAVQDYKDSRVVTLTHPYFDAQNLRDVMVENYAFEKEDTRLFKNPTRSDIIKTLDSLTKKISRKDNLVIFYAGHGFWDGALETGYWLPSDARKDDKANWLTNLELLNYLKNIKSRHTLLITDACFSGSIFKATTKNAFEQADVVIQKLYESPSRRAMTSGSLTTVPDQSAFMEHLIKQLRKNQDHYISATDIFVAIKNPTIRESKVEVLPQYGELNVADHQGGDFIFVKRNKKK
jgi:Caspase domain